MPGVSHLNSSSLLIEQVHSLLCSLHLRNRSSQSSLQTYQSLRAMVPSRLHFIQPLDLANIHPSILRLQQTLLPNLTQSRILLLRSLSERLLKALRNPRRRRPPQIGYMQRLRLHLRGERLDALRQLRIERLDLYSTISVQSRSTSLRKARYLRPPAPWLAQPPTPSNPSR